MIEVNLSKARLITHERRRQRRARAFEPLDAVIARRIPGDDSAAAETKRQEIRDRDAALQREIDASVSLAELTRIFVREGL